MDNQELKNAAEKVLAAWKEIPDADREAFNNVAGPLVSELRGLNTVFEANFDAADVAADKKEDVADTSTSTEDKGADTTSTDAGEKGADTTAAAE